MRFRGSSVDEGSSRCIHTDPGHLRSPVRPSNVPQIRRGSARDSPTNLGDVFQIHLHCLQYLGGLVILLPNLPENPFRTHPNLYRLQIFSIETEVRTRAAHRFCMTTKKLEALSNHHMAASNQGSPRSKIAPSHARPWPITFHHASVRRTKPFPNLPRQLTTSVMSSKITDAKTQGGDSSGPGYVCHPR